MMWPFAKKTETTPPPTAEEPTEDRARNSGAETVSHIVNRVVEAINSKDINEINLQKAQLGALVAIALAVQNASLFTPNVLLNLDPKKEPEEKTEKLREQESD